MLIVNVHDGKTKKLAEIHYVFCCKEMENAHKEHEDIHWKYCPFCKGAVSTTTKYVYKLGTDEDENA